MVSATTSSKLFNLEDSIAIKVWTSLDTPISLSCYLLHKYGEMQQLVKKAVSPYHYNDSMAFTLDYQAVSILSKSQRDVGIDRDEVALKSYIDCEEHCKLTNDRLFSLSIMDDPAYPLAVKARYWVRLILGQLTKSKLDSIVERSGYGPGVSLGLKTQMAATTSSKDRLKASGYSSKYGRRTLTTTAEALDYGLFCWPVGHRHLVEGFDIVVPKISFVPKNAKTSRSIEVQPDVNSFVQRGIGSLLRSLMLKFGFDLNDQTINQRKAEIGSLNNNIATLDLANASDTLSIGLVKFLLPPDWFELLSMFRTTHIELPSGYHPLEKFSAMGNGYTWELQSLLFTAMLLAATDSADLSVFAYGDDMTYSVEYDNNVRSILAFFGLRVNDSKTYVNSYFRESCGSDYFNGHPCRPFFLNGDKDDDYIENVYAYGNKIISWSYRINDGTDCNRLGLSGWLCCFTACPPRFRLRIPADFSRRLYPQGNGGFIHSLPEDIAKSSALRNRKDGRGFAGYWFPVYRRSTFNHPDPDASTGWLYANLNGVCNEDGKGSENFSHPIRYDIRTSYSLSWGSLDWHKP